MGACHCQADPGGGFDVVSEEDLHDLATLPLEQRVTKLEQIVEEMDPDQIITAYSAIPKGARDGR